MKKTVPFELFGPNQYIYFDVLRLAELEKALGVSIIKLIADQDVSISFCIAALTVGLKHHYHKATPTFYAEKMEEFFESGGTIQDVAVPIIKAIVKSGLFGKAEESTEEIEKNVMEGTE